MTDDLKPIVSGTVILNRVGDRWVFRHPVKFLYTVSRDYTLWLENRTLGIVATGRSWRALFDDLDEDLTDLWNDYAQEDDAALHESGIKLKTALLDNVRFTGGSLHGDQT